MATNINIEDKEVSIKEKKKMLYFLFIESTSRVVVPAQRSRSILVAEQEFNPSLCWYGCGNGGTLKEV